MSAVLFCSSSFGEPEESYNLNTETTQEAANTQQTELSPFIQFLNEHPVLLNLIINDLARRGANFDPNDKLTAGIMLFGLMDTFAYPLPNADQVILRLGIYDLLLEMRMHWPLNQIM